MVYVTKYESSFEIVLEIGKLQADAVLWTDAGLFMGALEPMDIPLHARMFADNLSRPQECELMVKIKTLERIYRPADFDLSDYE
jgi:hypothetical protein